MAPLTWPAVMAVIISGKVSTRRKVTARPISLPIACIRSIKKTAEAVGGGFGEGRSVVGGEVQALRGGGQAGA